MRFKMNKLLSPKLVLLAIFGLAGSVSIFAQDNPPPDNSRPQNEVGPKAKRPDLLRSLGLSPEQMQQVRKMNQARKPLMDAAMVRVRNANRALDEVIYADNLDEAAFQANLKEVQLAQAEAAKLRYLNELGIRKILTPEQLARFRELRQRFAPPPADRQGLPPDSKGSPGQPFRPPGQDRPN
jgi:Spy/CpxP family protein refolding chaperone